jgi:hypothetical protein
LDALAGSEERSTFLARERSFIMTLGLWIGADKMLAPFRETVKI